MTKARKEALREMVAEAPVTRRNRDDLVIYEVDLTKTSLNLSVDVGATGKADARKKALKHLELMEEGLA